MLWRQLYVGRELSPANIFRALTSRCKRTARRQVRQVRRESGNLIKTSLLVRRIGHRAQETARIWIGGPVEDVRGRPLLAKLSLVDLDDVIRPGRQPFPIQRGHGDALDPVFAS